MRKIKLIIIAIVSIFIGNKMIFANSINRIDMNIYIDEYGNASVEEVWNTNLNSGTEGYKVFNNLNNSSISNFRVRDDNNKEYNYTGIWNTNKSFSEKAYKNGINYNNGKIELCWGISEYGNRTYYLNYIIKNFVEQYNDYQGIYFNLLNLDQNAGFVNIVISSEEKINSSNSKIWGYGYEGTIVYNNDTIRINTDTLKNDEYITMLVKFEEPIFKTNNNVNKKFDDVYKEANKDNISNKLNSLISILFSNPFLFPIFFIILAYVFKYITAFILTILGNMFKNIFPNNNYEYTKSRRKLNKNKNINYYRDIPCNKDIELAYFILNKLNIIKTKKLKKGIISAFILKWLKLGYINVGRDKKSLIINKDIYSGIYKKVLSLDSVYENKLYSILYSAANKDKILNPYEFKKWSRKNYKTLNTWFSDILINKKKELEEKNLIIYPEEKKILGNLSYYKEFSDELMYNAYNLIGLKNFLLDFGTIKTKSSIEVELWEYYLIFAGLFGITDKISDELKNLYPDFNIDNYIRFNEILKTIDEFSESSYRGMKTSININQFKTDYNRTINKMNSGSSSGNGGSSLSSGGSSAGGSSGGGFR